MTELPVTPITYLGEMAAMSWRHGRELVAAMMCAMAMVAVAFITLPGHALPVVTSVMVAFLLFEAATAAWRLHRRQGIALATMRSLLEQNAVDRSELEWHLRARYRRREARINERNDTRLDRLAGEIGALQTEALERADDDGWPTPTVAVM
ncbi:MAG TPA: hypothetical protein VF219_15935 [Vicinamibacterales bacterium]